MPTFQELANMKVGLWNYTSGTSGTVDFSTLAADNLAGRDVCRVLTIAVIAGTSASTVKIDNRDTITIPANQSLSLNPNGTLTNPTIVFTGTASYTVEFCTNNKYGHSEGNV